MIRSIHRPIFLSLSRSQTQLRAKKCTSLPISETFTASLKIGKPTTRSEVFKIDFVKDLDIFIYVVLQNTS